MNNTDRYEQLRSLFEQALEMDDTERRWFLQSINNRDVAADVERLLESSACCGSFCDKKPSPIAKQNDV
ncbi:hypothetical protein [Stieleria mannarensis]|uniref:hypothetical protein n=1 Tax=Stieleria mannarensis TaxID=2755585 RepID=UPI0015FF47C0|nr:hypothetical protein [Rhodopirellula sp. JC639]